MPECKVQDKLAKIVDACREKMAEQLHSYESFHLELLYGQFLLDARRVQAMHVAVCYQCERLAKETQDREKQACNV